MKNKIIAGLVLVLFGIALLIAAFQFAPLAYCAPGAGQRGPTILEFAYGFPAFVFTVAGVAGILIGVVVGCLALKET